MILALILSCITYSIKYIMFITIAGSEKQCARPENIHTPPTEGIGISWGKGGSVRPKNLMKCVKLYWNFQRGGGLKKKSLPLRRYGYFLELHNLLPSTMKSISSLSILESRLKTFLFSKASNCVFYNSKLEFSITLF